MSLITQADLARFQEERVYDYNLATGKVTRKAAKRLANLSASASRFDRFDIFLSHKFSDAEQLEALQRLLKSYGHTVYIDWVEDPELDRSKVTAETADRLRTRMAQCSCLFFATTSTHSDSKWMPWELGYVDGKYGKAAICPIVANGTNGFEGQEYLGIYPYVDHFLGELWINRSSGKFIRFREWLEGKALPA